MHVMPLQTKLMPWHWLTKTFRENYLITGHTFRFCNLRFPAKVTTWYDVISFGSSFFFNSARSREYGTTSRIFGWLHLKKFKKFKKFKMLLLLTWFCRDAGWRHFVDNDISWTLFFKMGDFSWTFSKGDFLWTLLVTSHGQFYFKSELQC